MVFRCSAVFRAYRIADARRPIFDGTGAALSGGRWNSPGRRVIYAPETYAGAMLEVLVHAGIGRLPRHHAFMEITVPASTEIEELSAAELPGWDAADLLASRAYGDRWYDERRTAVLLVPSVVTRIERNVLINQEHPDFPRIKASAPTPVLWDERFGCS